MIKKVFKPLLKIVTMVKMHIHINRNILIHDTLPFKKGFFKKWTLLFSKDASNWSTVTFIMIQKFYFK